MITFGTVEDGVTYVDRHGAYGLLQNERGLLAVVRTPAGLFLPGGGVEAGESPKVALAREFMEEIAYRVVEANFLAEAAQYHRSVFYGASFRKIGAFFAVKATPVSGQAWAKDHLLEWRSSAQARLELAQEFQRWAVSALVPWS